MVDEIHLCHVFATFSPGGPQIRLCQIINALPKTWRHTIMAMDGQTGARSLLLSDLEVEFTDPGFRRHDPSFPFRLAKQLRGLNPDLVLTYNWGAIEAVVAARIARLPRIIHGEFGFGPEEAKGSQKRRRVFARRIILRNISAVLAPSLNLVRIINDVWKLPADRIVYIPNGIDCDYFSPSKDVLERHRLGIGDTDCVIGTVAHLRKEKNQRLLIEIFAEIAKELPVHLLIIGEGPERQYLTEITRQKGIEERVHFLGYHQRPREYYRVMDVFALSSMTEQMPVSVLEAMATGLPVVSFDVGDVRMMVSQENQTHVVPPGEESFYLGALRSLIQSDEKRELIGKRNRQKCLKEYRQDKMIDNYQKLYERVLTT